MAMILAMAMLALQAPPLAEGLQPMARVVGSCWRGNFANRPGQSDTHCFTPIYGGAFIRDYHVVAGAPEPYEGETIYRLDADSGEIRFHYYARGGVYSAGAAQPSATGIDFPEEVYRGVDGEMTVRTRWTWDGPDAYLAISESQTRAGWEEAWRIRMVRAGPATPLR